MGGGADFVELEVILTLEMDGERGDAEDGGVNFDEFGDDAAGGVTDHRSAGDREVPVEPGVPEAA